MNNRSRSFIVMLALVGSAAAACETPPAVSPGGLPWVEGAYAEKCREQPTGEPGEHDAHAIAFACRSAANALYRENDPRAVDYAERGCQVETDDGRPAHDCNTFAAFASKFAEERRLPWERVLAIRVRTREMCLATKGASPEDMCREALLQHELEPADLAQAKEIVKQHCYRFGRCEHAARYGVELTPELAAAGRASGAGLREEREATINNDLHERHEQISANEEAERQRPSTLEQLGKAMSAQQGPIGSRGAPSWASPSVTPTAGSAAAPAPSAPPTSPNTASGGTQPAPAPAAPVLVTASGVSDYWFADDGSCCQKLHAMSSLAVAAMSRACREKGGFAKEETVRWSGGSYCSNEACNGAGCSHKFRCRQLAEGVCQLPGR